MMKSLLVAALALQAVRLAHPELVEGRARLGQGAVAPAPKFDSGRAWEHLRQLVAIGPRPSGSPAIEQTRKYIKDQLASAGLTAVEQSWDDQTPIDKIHLFNLIATIPGARKERSLCAAR